MRTIFQIQAFIGLYRKHRTNRHLGFLKYFSEHSQFMYATMVYVYTFLSKFFKNSWSHVFTSPCEVNHCLPRFYFNEQYRWKSDVAKSGEYAEWVKTCRFRSHNNPFTSWTMCGHALPWRSITSHINRPGHLALMTFRSFKSVSKYQSAITVFPYSRYSL